MKNLHRIFFVFALIMGALAPSLRAQNAEAEQVNAIRAAIKAGSSKELIRYMDENVDLNLAAQKTSYSKSQAEYVLKDFFKKYPVTDFQYVHQGKSKEGHKYAIGNYQFDGGSYRVYILLKLKNGVYNIDTLDFSEE